MMQQEAAVPDTVACHTCQREVPRSVAEQAEGADYLLYFCGLDCFAKWRSEAERSAAHAGFAAVEQGRIEFLVQRDGLAAATQWVRRTLGIYRQAVLNPHHHASRDEYRRRFIQSYCSFKSWLYRATPGARAHAS
jgi:hypothetical protein